MSVVRLHEAQNLGRESASPPVETETEIGYIILQHYFFNGTEFARMYSVTSVCWGLSSVCWTGPSTLRSFQCVGACPETSA